MTDVHLVTPPDGKVDASGRFALEYRKGAVHMAATGKIDRAGASGTYKLEYAGFDGQWVTACLDSGTWKATRR